MKRVSWGLSALLACLTAAPAATATSLERVERFRVGAGSEVSYLVKVKTLLLLDEQIEGRNPDVKGEFALAPGAATGWVEAEVAGFATGIKSRDTQVRKILGAPAQPKLRFELARLGGYAPGASAGQALVAGKLTVHGHASALELPMAYRRSGATLTIDGTHDVHFSDFGLEPPMLGYVFKRAPDLLTLRLHLVATRLP